MIKVSEALVMKSAQKPLPCLVVSEGNDKGKVLTLRPGTTLVGRSRGDILLSDPRMSRCHIAFHYDEKTHSLSFTDLNSLNGTLLNQEKAPKGDLKDGDRIQVGNTCLDCQLAPAEPSVPAKKSKAPKKRRAKKDPNFVQEPVLSHGDLSDGPSAVTDLHSQIKAKFSVNARHRRIAILSIVLLSGLAYLLLKSVPTHPPLEEMVKSVRQLESQGHFTDALELAEAAKLAYPENFGLQMQLGDLYSQINKNEQAIFAYRKAHDLNPNDPMVHLRLVRIYLLSGLEGQAKQEVAHIDTLVKEQRGNREFFLEAAKLFLEFRTLEGASEKVFILAKALQTELAPDSTVGFKLEAQLLLQEGESEKAFEVLSYAKKLDSQDEWILEQMALAKFRMKDLEVASRIVEDWLEVNPQSTKALLIMAYLKVGARDTEGALENLAKIRDVAAHNNNDPHLAEALYVTGQIYLQTDKVDEGRELLATSCKMGYQESCKNQDTDQRAPQSLKKPKDRAIQMLEKTPSPISNSKTEKR